MLDQMPVEVQGSQVMVEVTQVKNDTFLFGINDLTSSLQKQLRVSVFVLRYIKLKLWIRIPEERIGNYFKNHLLKAIFHGLQKKGQLLQGRFTWHVCSGSGMFSCVRFQTYFVH